MLRHALSLAVVAGFIVAGFTAAAWADIPPPPPEAGFKRVPYEHVVKLAAEIPGYKFYFYQQLGLGGDVTIQKELALSTKTGVVVPGNSSPSVRTGVIAVPVTLVEELKTNEEIGKLLLRENRDKLPAGVAFYETSGTTEDLKVSDPRTKVENVITISPDEKAGVKFDARETPPTPEEKAAAEAASGLPVATVAAGIAGTLSFVALGLWFFRRQ